MNNVAILYGKHTNPQSLSVEGPEFVRLLKSVAGRSVLPYACREARDREGDQVWRDRVMESPLLCVSRDLRDHSIREATVTPIPRIITEAVGILTLGKVADSNVIPHTPHNRPPL